MNTEGKRTALADDAELYRIPPDDDNLSEHEKWEKLNRRERADYFRDYYLKKVIAFAAVGIFVVVFLVSVLKPRPEAVVSLAVVDDYWDDEATTDLAEAATRALDLDTSKQEIRIDDSYYLDDTQSPDSVMMIERFDTYVMAGTINCIIADRAKFETYMKGGYFLPLEQVLGDDIDEYKDRLVTGKSSDDTTNQNYGISLEDCGVLNKVSAYQADPVIGVVANAKETDYEYLKEFIEYILNEQ